MIDKLILRHNCTGCSACFNSCENNCIHMKFNQNSFLTPVVATETCTKCGLCIKACPLLKKQVASVSQKPVVYAAYLKDKTALANSTSGGIFVALANLMIRNGGVVCGAVFEKDYYVRLKIIDKLEDISSLQGSKYVQSLPGTIYREIRTLLKSRKVLFTGLPCQVAGLKSFLGNENKNLFTVDIICHGVPSAQIYKDYLTYIEKRKGAKVVFINQRYKKKRWSPMLTVWVKKQFEDDSKNIVYYTEDEYSKAYNDGYIFNTACYSCKFSSLPRQGDVSLGDYYGLGILYPFPDSCRGGVSQVLLNNPKGIYLFEQIKNEIIWYRRPLKEALFYNTAIWKPAASASKIAFRNKIMTAYADYGFDYIYEKFLRNSPKDKIIVFLKKVIRKLLNDKLLLRLELVRSKKSRLADVQRILTLFLEKEKL